MVLLLRWSNFLALVMMVHFFLALDVSSGQRRKQEAEEKRDVRAKDAEAAHEASVKSLSQPSRGVSSVDVETLIETSTAGRHPTRTEANTSGLGSASEMLEDIMGAGNVADFQDHVHAMALMAAQEEARAREMEELQLAI
eukprot:gene6885-8219_t